MTESEAWHADTPLPEFPRNLAAMLNRNVERLGDHPLYQEFRNGCGVALTWQQFQRDVSRLQQSLREHGLRAQDRVAILSPNRKEMLELELAVMAAGAVAVPIFAGYSGAQTRELLDFCDPLFVAVADANQFQKLASPDRYRLVIHFDPPATAICGNIASLAELIAAPHPTGLIGDESIAADSVCLMMYTSGTMGKVKLVQLTHRNILSQQAALRISWQLDATDRFLSYLPWHHSFGGIFEKYAALYNGAVLSLEHGHGKQISTLLENWRRVKPTVFFSVPRIYQQLVTEILQDPALEKVVFHEGLRFVFTAAAPLPANISEMFERHGVPVYEGWGLTETSPCCTVTDPAVPRKSGVVGKPIPGVGLKLTDYGEILVRGPNVMKGYFRNSEATRAVLSDDGWFATGDIGEFTGTGLRLIARKDRVFKLSNGEKIVATEIENQVIESCCFLAHAFVAGGGRDFPVVLLLPNHALLSRKPDQSTLTPGCSCPASVKELAHCLARCLRELNEKIDAPYMRLHTAMLVDRQLSVENGGLTPSMKLAPNVVATMFKAHVERLYSDGANDGENDVYILRLEHP